MSSFDEELERAKGGDDEAVEQVLLPYLPALTAFVRLRLDDRLARRESAADIVQSVCREVITDLPRLQAVDEKGFRGWLFGVVANKLASKRNHHRAARRDLRQEVKLGFDSRVDDQGLLAAYGRTVSPSQDAAAREQTARIEAAFDELPDDYRDVLVHIGIAGLTYQETAVLMARSEDSIRQLAVRARARLATLLR